MTDVAREVPMGMPHLTNDGGRGAMPAPNGPRKADIVRGVAAHALLALFGVFFLAPMLWMLLSSFDAHASWAMEWPHFTLRNFRAALGGTNVQSLINSLILSAVATGVATICAIPAAYALSRRRIPLKGALLLATLFLSAIPLTILVIPVFQMFAARNWLSIGPTAVFLGVTALPFEIYLIKNFVDAVPRELEEAARIERANTWQVVMRVVMPLALPGICAAAIFGFVNAWGSFVVPLVLISASSQQPGPVAIFGFISSVNVSYGGIAAFSLVYSVPVFVLYALASRFFRGGFALGGAVKG